MFKVLQYTTISPLGIGGVEKYLSNLNTELAAQGNNVQVSSKWVEGADIIHTHGDLAPLRAGVSSLRRNGLWIPVFHGTTLGRMLACKEYLSPSGLKGIAKERLFLSLSDAAIAVGTQAEDELRKLYFYRKPIRVIPNGSIRFSTTNELPNQPIFLFLGRSSDRVKNTGLVVNGLSCLRSKYKDLELRMAPGDKETNSSNWIKKLGPLDQTGIEKELTTSRILVLASFYEGDSLVLRDAKNAGIPILASKIRPIEETLADYPNKVFFDPRNLNSFVSAAEDTLNKNYVRKIVERPWKLVAQEYSDFYRFVAGSRKS
ncbi:MAG: glycosyltransferase family 4 protein [Bacteriovoracia bacterium]